MISFIRNLVEVKADRAVQGAVEALVRWDPKAATEAELQTMEQQLDALGRQVAEARQSYNREQQEAQTVTQLSQQRMAAAEQLQARMATEADPSQKAAIERSLGTMVGMLEQMRPDIEQETQDADDAGGFLQTLEGTYTQAGQKLKSARDALNRAQRDMNRAEQQRDVAERLAEGARQAAGLTNATSGLSIALKAMQDNAARSLATAEAANAKAKLLQPTRPEQEDPNIAAAMAAASGISATPVSLSDRLAAIQQRQPAGLPKQLEGPQRR